MNCLNLLKKALRDVGQGDGAYAADADEEAALMLDTAHITLKTFKRAVDDAHMLPFGERALVVLEIFQAGHALRGYEDEHLHLTVGNDGGPLVVAGGVGIDIADVAELLAQLNNKLLCGTEKQQRTYQQLTLGLRLLVNTPRRIALNGGLTQAVLHVWHLVAEDVQRKPMFLW